MATSTLTYTVTVEADESATQNLISASGYISDHLTTGLGELVSPHGVVVNNDGAISLVTDDSDG